MRKYLPFYFFLIALFFSNTAIANNIPKPIPKPAFVEKKYKDFFNAVKKQQWQIAKAIAYDYQNTTLLNYLEWLDITRPGSKHNFEFLVNFLEKNPNWPKMNEIKKKIESSINETTPIMKIINWFDYNEPLTVKGSIDFLEAKIKLGIEDNKIQNIRDIWINKNLTFSQQKYFIKKYSKYWTTDDNWERFDRLLWEGKTLSAKRTLMRIKGAKRKLGEARLALSRRAGNVSELIKKIPKNLLNDPGLIYERMRWRRKAKLDTAEDFLFDPPQNIRNYRNWWINTRVVVRRLINKKKYEKAYKILANHNIPLNSISGSEAEWLAGWVAFTFLGKKNSAYLHFEEMYSNVKHPLNKTKALYWMNKSNDKNNKKTKIFYQNNLKYPYSFYGQNFILENENLTFDKNLKKIIRPTCCKELFEVIKILQDAGELERVYPFLEQAYKDSQTREEKNYILYFASKMENKNFMVKLSKIDNFKSYDFSFPNLKKLIPVKFQNPKELALIHAIILQESAFKVNAYSHAGARGLMQLMPYTAKVVARDINIKYYKNALTRNSNYNILLGSTYIKQLLEKFDNSLPLALAGYNAGPGRVKIWVKRYGDPRKKQISYENWIESIPIYETRNYIKKVISNFRVYKEIFSVNDNNKNDYVW
tara:strand:+ start:2129 stop:4069 length:1941 start_codon:yes stop_codon:yes gene_type:complete